MILEKKPLCQTLNKPLTLPDYSWEEIFVEILNEQLAFTDNSWEEAFLRPEQTVNIDW